MISVDAGVTAAEGIETRGTASTVALETRGAPAAPDDGALKL